MNRKKVTFFVIFAILTACLTVYNFLIKGVKSIGVIGSADGPTSIFISQSNGSSVYLYVIIIIIAVVFAAIVKYRR